MDTTCRTCLSTGLDDMESIFNERDNMENISKLLTDMVGLEYLAAEDGLPKNICPSCLQSLLAAYEFCQMCRNSEESLKLPLKFQERIPTPCPEPSNSAEDENKFSLEIEVLAMSDGEINVGELVMPETEPTIKSTKKRARTSADCLCSVCGKKFSTNQRLKNHHLTHTGEKNFECPTCHKTFATKSRIRSHQRTHTGEKPYKCEMCPLSFAQGNALKCHLRTHTGEKPYDCKICGKRFSQNTILKTHMSIHVGKNVKCELCDKKFSRPSYLILHRREHTGEKPYACHKCPNRYMQKSHLDRHLDTHLGIKHKCHICHKEYTKSWSLKVHLYTHSEQSQHPFHCEICQMSFVRRKKYTTHMKQHEPPPQTIPVVDAIQETEVQLPVIESFGDEAGGHIEYIIVQRNFDEG